MTKSIELRENLCGPIVGLPTLFKSTLEVDHDAIRKHVEFLISNGIKVLMLSQAISEFQYLTEEEIEQITKTVVEAVAGRATILVSTFQWWTGKAVEFAEYAEDVGADGLLVIAPFWSYSEYDPEVHDKALHKHFKAVAEATDIGIIFHDRWIAGLSGQRHPLSISLVEQIAKIDNVVGIKEESVDGFRLFEILKRVGNKVAVIDDYGKMSFIFTSQYGSPAYISGVGQFAPKVALQFWDSLKTGRIAQARKLAVEVDLPFSSKCNQFGWLATIKAAMEICGLPSSPMRTPGVSLTLQQKDELKQLMSSIGLLDH
jgi:4-hydroxy-tetrahydrodipicolinate synthase